MHFKKRNRSNKYPKYWLIINLKMRYPMAYVYCHLNFLYQKKKRKNRKKSL